MRKWMADRLKRRKKAKDEGANTTAAPLQPAYFDAESPSAPSAPEVHEPKAPEPPREVAHSVDDAEPEPVQARRSENVSGNNPANDPRRKRRRRGGRGRGKGGAQRSPQPVGVSQSARPEAATTAQAPVATPSRPTKGTVILAIGLPGSGKSSWFKRHNINPLSSDMLRSILFDDPNEQRFQDLVFSNLRSMLKARLIARRPLNYVDATNLTPHERHSWIKLGKDFGYEVQAVYFDVPLEVCLERNQKREQAVEEVVMRRMAEKLKPPTFEEGFSKITMVRVKKKGAAEAVESE